MKKESVVYGIIGLLTGSLITIVVASSAVNNNNMPMMRMMGMHQTGNQYVGQGTVMGNIDRHFIEQMIPHHEDAITMANLATKKAKRPENKKLAQDIITSQSSEITKMKTWYKSWYGNEVPQTSYQMGAHVMSGNSGMHMGMMGNDTDMTRLEQAENFDKVFIEDMIPHHQMAIMMATMLKNGTSRPEMTKLADDIISAQTKEIDEMRQWYQAW